MRENQSLVTVSVDNVNLGVFEVRTGGDVDSEETAYGMGGMGPQRQFGGPPQTTNVTVRCLYDDARRARFKWLESRAGKGRAVVTDQPLDSEGNVVGDPDVYAGVLKRVKRPDSDRSSNNAGQMEMEISVDGLPA